MQTKRPKGIRFHARAAYRSGLEVAISAALTAAGVAFLYEQVVIPFNQPAKARKYTPDFVLPNGIIVETKGLWESDDRQKHLWVREQHPKLDIRLVFSNANAKLYKGSPTTYATFCDKHGIPWANKTIPVSWLTEKGSLASKRALEALGHK